MTAPPAFLDAVLGRRSQPPHKPNICDTASKSSTAIASHIFDSLGISGTAAVEGQAAGAALERQVASYLLDRLWALQPARGWQVQHGSRVLADFIQYEHLFTLQQIIDSDVTNTLAVSIGRDYQIKPDVTVGIPVPGYDLPALHASVSCKLTVRSDRVQNIRHEATILTRYRRGRQPHIVAVTAEPLPTRLASIARGTGDLDALYHVALPELVDAVKEVTGDDGEQGATLRELIGQRRLLDITELPSVLMAM